MAQAPIPSGVILKSVCPSVRNVISKSPEVITVMRYCSRSPGVLSRRWQYIFQSLHPPDDGGKVFLNSRRGFFRIDSRGRLRRGYRESKLVRGVQNQAEILVHKTNGKLR